MLWYKGWLETRFRLVFALGMMSFITDFSVLPPQRSASLQPQRRDPWTHHDLGSVPCRDCLRDACRSRNRHTTLSHGNQRSPRIDIVHTLAPGKSSPAAGGPSRNWMVGATAALAILCAEMWFVSPSPEGDRDRRRDVPIRGNRHCLCVGDLLPGRAAGYLPRRPMARLGHDDFIRWFMVALRPLLYPCLR